MYNDDVYEAFNAVVSEEDRDDVLTMMSESAHSSDCHKGVITILQRTRHNSINVTVAGILEYKGEQYHYVLDDGDWNGTELVGWEDLGREYSEPVPDPLTAQPTFKTRQGWIERGAIKQLLELWDLFLTRPDVEKAIRDYAYDRFFQPGIVTESHYRDIVAKWGMEYVRESEAKEIRRNLEAMIPK